MGETAGRGRRLVVLLAVGAAYACNPTGNGCDSAPASELRFFKNGVLRNTRSTLGADTFAPVELAPVPGDSLPINVDMYATGVSLAPVDNQGILLGRQMEAHLFTEDLPGTMAYLRALKANDPSGANHWDVRTLLPVTGQDVILTYPPSPLWDLSQRYVVTGLGAPAFWPNASPLPPASDPTGQGSVKSARLYQPGMCSLEYPFQSTVGDGLFNQIGDQLWDNFKDEPPCGSERTFSRVSTMLDEGLGAGGTPRGGFFVYFTFQGSGCVTPVVASGNADYEMGLDDGRLAVIPRINDVFTTGTPTQKVTDALQTTLPSKLHDLAIQKQVKAFLPCDPQADVATSTQASRALLGGFAIDGAIKLGYINLSEQTRVKTAVENPANWVCDAGIAKFMLRAKRVNVYPDGVEMVWFDEANLDDPMFGLYAAAVLNSSVGDLCARPRTFVGSPYAAVASRPISTVCAGNFGCAF